MRKRFVRNFLAISLACINSGSINAYADVLDPQPNFPRMPAKERLTAPKEATLEDLFPRSELPVQPLTAYPLEGTQIPLLTPKSVKELGLNHFIVVTNTSFKSMSDVYRDNRLRGKPNFVTSDCILHPYIAFTNGIAANVVARIAPDLQTLLIGMYNASAGQYKASQDASLRNDAEKNCAYLGVALKLLNPALQIAPIGQSNALITSEIQNIQGGKTAKSVVFDRMQDFSAFRSIGWYNGSPQFANFYRCQQWLTRMYFTLSDPDTTVDDSATSEFRRSVLLFQSLQQAKVGTLQGLPAWQRINTALDTVGTMASREHLLLAPDYAAVFSPGQKLSLTGLTEPFYRTKLLLSIRRQRPLEVGAASIFNPSEQKSSADNFAYFRLFPPNEDPELDWMRERAHTYTSEGVEGPETPLALFDLYAHGAAQASNLLADSIWHMDPSLMKIVPVLMRTVKAAQSQSASGQSSPPQSAQSQPAQSQPGPYSLGLSRWQILSLYFKPPGEGAQPALKSALWLNRRLESAFAAWLDGHISVAPIERKTDAGSDHPATTTPPTQSATTAAAVQPAKFQYLDPCPDLFRRIATDSEELGTRLTAQGFMTDDIKTRLGDFQKLATRLAGIADRELSFKAVPPEDMQLLAYIDQVLDKVSFPLQGTLYLNSVDSSKGGCNLGLGRAGYLHILCHTTRGVMLCRGAVYTYYEIPGGPVKPEHWDRKLEFALVRPPFWVSDFDVVQDSMPATGVNQ